MSMDISSITQDIERTNRRSLAVTLLIMAGIVISVLVFLHFTSIAVKRAQDDLAQTVAQLQVLQKNIESSKAELRAAQAALAKANDEIAELGGKVASLNGELEQKSKALQEAAALGQHIYQLDWNDTKSMFVINERAAPVLDKILELRDRTHWGMANTMDGGFNSPGFAAIILQQLGKPKLTDLQRETEDPRPGDIVVYRTGYHMFYFTDQQGRPFVVGMTPFGVTALNYDFGVLQTGVLRTGFSP